MNGKLVVLERDFNEEYLCDFNVETWKSGQKLHCPQMVFRYLGAVFF